MRNVKPDITKTDLAKDLARRVDAAVGIRFPVWAVKAVTAGCIDVLSSAFYATGAVVELSTKYTVQIVMQRGEITSNE